MVTIRLARFGSKKRPYYHIVVADSEEARNGRFIEQIGTYDPSVDTTGAKLRLDRADHWISVGAQPSTRVKHLIAQSRRGATGSAAPADYRSAATQG